MPEKCFIPVIPAGEHTVPKPFFGYDQESDRPYVLELTFAEYCSGEVGSYGEITGMVVNNVFAHPFALFACFDEADKLIRTLFE